jgi:hypothetical protein
MPEIAVIVPRSPKLVVLSVLRIRDLCLIMSMAIRLIDKLKIIWLIEYINFRAIALRKYGNLKDVLYVAFKLHWDLMLAYFFLSRSNKQCGYIDLGEFSMVMQTSQT